MWVNGIDKQSDISFMWLDLKNVLAYFVFILVSSLSWAPIMAFISEVWCDFISVVSSQSLKKDRWEYNFIAILLLQNIITEHYALYEF